MIQSTTCLTSETDGWIMIELHVLTQLLAETQPTK
jgi:hypothetical protein